ncbi:hypothetical protein HDV64DRAFT_36805 [Trichoderma sp. TUCIM 5745]
MNQPATYTPLESLFLFQSLLSHGVDGGAFARISELLKGNALIKSGDTYDAARLSPEALQQLFLQLLRDEINGEAERADGDGAAAGGGGGGGSDGSRKRKLSSPPLPTLKEVYENVDKIPILVDRLYARYRDHTVGLIREDERRFAMLQREIQLLERSEKERLAKVAASQNVTPTLAPRDPRTAAGAAPTTTTTTTTTTTPVVAGVQPPVPTANGATPSPGQVPATPASIRKGPTPNTHVPPPKPPMSSIAAPKVAPPSQLVPGTPPPRTSALPKPPNGASSVLQAPPGAPTQSTAQVLQPPAQQPPKQVISPRPETAVPQPPQPQIAPGTAAPGSLKWEKPYQPPQTAQAPSAEQFSPPIPPSTNNVALQKPPQTQQPQQQQISPTPPPPPPPQQQQQPQPPQQWQRQPVPHPQHPTPQQSQQPHTQYPPQPPHGQTIPTPPQQQARPSPAKPVLVHPQSVGQLVAPLQPGPPRPVGPGAVSQVRPPSTTPAATPGRPIQPQQQQPQAHRQQQVQQATPQTQHIQRTLPAQTSLLAQKFQARGQNQRPLASATSPKGTPSVSAGGSPIPNKAAPGVIATPRWQPGASAAQQGARVAPPASPAPKDKIINSTNAAQAPRPIPEHVIRQVAATPPVRRPSPAASVPRTPAPSSPISLKRGFGTKWASQSTPSTPGPITSEPESPAYEPVSPPIPRPAVGKDSVNAVPKLAVPKPSPKVEATPPAKAPRGRPPRSMQKGRGASATPSATGTRRSQSVVSQTDELSLDHSVTKVKKEAAATPRLREATGDTTADESMPGRGLLGTPNSPPTHVLWTRGFTKVSSSALDQISSHRDANMFATALREKDAPNYRQIVLQPQDITSIRSAIKAGNKAALQAAANLSGGDPGTASVWLPISDDLVPPRGIINSAHLERELVHMFCNAIIKNTQSMFLEVEKLLGDLRAAEKDRGIPPISTTRQGSVATPAEDTAEEEDELAGDGDSASASGTAKRRRISTRS